jgi:hypothetical protein
MSLPIFAAVLRCASPVLIPFDPILQSISSQSGWRLPQLGIDLRR